MEEFSGTHASTILICRFVNFIKSIKKSTKRAVQILYQKVKNNLNTVTGRNVQFVVETTGFGNIEVLNLKQNVLFLDDETEVMVENEDLDM